MINIGILSKLFGKKKPKNSNYAPMMTGNVPIFSQYGTDIYSYDVVQQAIRCIVSEVKKLQPRHVREGTNNRDITAVRGNIQTVLDCPNPVMTTTEFLEKITWLLLLNYNAFIIPFYDVWTDKDGNEIRSYRQLYPIQPSNVEFIEDSKGDLYVHFTFSNGYDTTLNYNDVIHIKYNYSVNEYMGGNVNGQPDNQTLLKTLGLNDILLTGVAKGMQSSYAVNGVVKYNTMMDDRKIENALKEMERKLANSENGFLPLDLKCEFEPIKNEVSLVDADTLEFIDSKILRHWGVPLCILTGDYTKEQYEAFYQKTIEPIVIALSQAFTKKMFTPRQLSFGNKIQFYPKDCVFMSVAETLEMIRLLGDSGSLYENEKRVFLGLPPLPELEGVRKMSLNYVDVDIANEYQIGGDTDERQISKRKKKS